MFGPKAYLVLATFSALLGKWNLAWQHVTSNTRASGAIQQGSVVLQARVMSCPSSCWRGSTSKFGGVTLNSSSWAQSCSRHLFYLNALMSHISPLCSKANASSERWHLGQEVGTVLRACTATSSLVLGKDVSWAPSSSCCRAGFPWSVLLWHGLRSSCSCPPSPRLVKRELPAHREDLHSW